MTHAFTQLFIKSAIEYLSDYFFISTLQGHADTGLMLNLCPSGTVFLPWHLNVIQTPVILLRNSWSAWMRVSDVETPNDHMLHHR